MSNRDKAAYIIENYGLNCTQCNERKDICQTCAHRARFAVDALADAGLLVPDTDHPAYLETWEDFENAPDFTIICPPGESPLIKRKDGRWKTTAFDTPLNTVDFIEGGDGTPMIVLRWGQGEVPEGE